MEKTCLYEPVNYKAFVVPKQEVKKKKGSWKPMLRQVMICSGIWNGYFLIGLYMGAPAVYIPQLRKEANSTDAVSQEMVSWISAVNRLSAIPCFVLAIISGRVGRKYPFFGISITCLIGSLVFYFGTSATHFLIAAILQGPMLACVVTISVIVLIEYSSPKNRGMFLTLKSASYNWGVWVANALGTFLPWKSIAVVCVVCSLYNILTTLFWCESPPWLAYNGKYEECEKAHRWIKGDDSESEKDLETLIRSCKEYREKQAKERITRKNLLIRTLKTIQERTFYMPLLLCIAVLSLYQTSGKSVCVIYIIDIIKKITSSESTAYSGMLLLDGVSVTSMYISCILAKYIKRRTMLLTGSMGGISALLILSLYLYLCKLKILNENAYVTLSLLSMFFLLITFGPIILAYSLYGELMPLRYRTHGMMITGIFISALAFTSVKTAPRMFTAFEIHGAFLFYGLTSACIILFLYVCLPETKDKTLQEIEEYFVDKNDIPESRTLTECISNK